MTTFRGCPLVFSARQAVFATCLTTIIVVVTAVLFCPAPHCCLRILRRSEQRLVVTFQLGWLAVWFTQQAPPVSLRSAGLRSHSTSALSMAAYPASVFIVSVMTRRTDSSSRPHPWRLLYTQLPNHSGLVSHPAYRQATITKSSLVNHSAEQAVWACPILITINLSPSRTALRYLLVPNLAVNYYLNWVFPACLRCLVPIILVVRSFHWSDFLGRILVR